MIDPLWGKKGLKEGRLRQPGCKQRIMNEIVGSSGLAVYKCYQLLVVSRQW
jgi:hypothetical protein